MIKALVTGSNGQLGKSFQHCTLEYPEFDFIYKDFFELDICDENQLGNFFKKNKVNVVINCAAYTDVDQSEVETEKAEKINTNAVGILSDLSIKYKFKLIHFSTDYIFDGTSNKPYVEDSPIAPLGVYGKTKAEGEKLILKTRGNAWIIRTSWLFSPFGENFVKKIISLSQKKNKINVVSDQIGSPTYTLDLVRDVLKIISNRILSNDPKILHYTNAGQTSWYEFAKKIKVLCKLNCFINSIETDSSKALAKRPKYSVLSCENFKKEFNLSPRSWELALQDCLIRMKK
jgi:dTDP-4-dehydrorhamnose reductase